ncbi:MAG: cell division protein FtsQ/DivIB [Gammaproteobacteria bacterium]|jgi:cell division protein FtsQ
MGARRINQKAQTESRLTQWLTARSFTSVAVVALLLTVGLAVHHLYRPQTLPFKTIQVYGQLNWLDRDTLNQVVVDSINGGFFSLDVAALKRRVEQQTWVKTVAVRRVWPDVLQLTVHEQQPVAIWNGTAMVNQQGELFGANSDTFPSHVAKFQGPSGMHQTLTDYFNTLSGMIEKTGLQIAGLNVDSRRALQLTLSNGVQLMLGRVQRELDITTEMKRFVQACQSTLAAKMENIQLVDLRYTNGLAVRWKPDTGSGVDNKNHASNVVSNAQG